jgi:hypothetical protein
VNDSDGKKHGAAREKTAAPRRCAGGIVRGFIKLDMHLTQVPEFLEIGSDVGSIS